MIAPLVLAAAVAALPQTPEASCDPQDLGRIINSDKKLSPQNRSEMDRRIALVLHAERETEDQAALLDGGKARSLELYLPIALAALALVGAAGAAGNRRRGMAAVMVLCALGAGALYARGRQQRLDASQRVSQLRACRLKVLETRSQLEHNELARCIGDLGETDEDLMVMESKLKNGKPVMVEEVTKLRNELNHR